MGTHVPGRTISSRLSDPSRALPQAPNTRFSWIALPPLQPVQPVSPAAGSPARAPAGCAPRVRPQCPPPRPSRRRRSRSPRPPRPRPWRTPPAWRGRLASRCRLWPAAECLGWRSSQPRAPPPEAGAGRRRRRRQLGGGCAQSCGAPRAVPAWAAGGVLGVWARLGAAWEGREHRWEALGHSNGHCRCPVAPPAASPARACSGCKCWRAAGRGSPPAAPRRQGRRAVGAPASLCSVSRRAAEIGQAHCGAGVREGEFSGAVQQGSPCTASWRHWRPVRHDQRHLR